MTTIPQIGPVYAPTASPARRTPTAPSQRTPAFPDRLFYRELLGVRQFDAEHIAIRLGYAYHSPQGSTYRVEAAALIETETATFTGVYWLRSCTCPDHTKRRGAAAPHSIERVCKHMELLGQLVASWHGRRVQIPNLIVSRREMGGADPIIWADGLTPLDKELGRRR